MSIARFPRGGRAALCALLLALSPLGCALPAPAADLPPDCLSVDRAQEVMASRGYRLLATVTGIGLAAPVAMYRATAPGDAAVFDVALVFEAPPDEGGVLLLGAGTCIARRALWPARLWPSVRTQILGEPT